MHMLLVEWVYSERPVAALVATHVEWWVDESCPPRLSSIVVVSPWRMRNWWSSVVSLCHQYILALTFEQYIVVYERMDGSPRAGKISSSWPSNQRETQGHTVYSYLYVVNFRVAPPPTAPRQCVLSHRSLISTREYSVCVVVRIHITFSRSRVLQRQKFKWLPAFFCNIEASFRRSRQPFLLKFCSP